MKHSDHTNSREGCRDAARPQGSRLWEAGPVPSAQCDEALPSFDDLQPAFDDSSRRLAQLLDRPGARAARLNSSAARSGRSRMARAWGLFAFLCLGISAYWGAALWQYDYDIYVRLFSLFLEAVFLTLSAVAIAATRSHRRHPARTGLDSMLRHARHRNDPDTRSPRYEKFSALSLNRAATFGIAASVALILVSCTTTVGDGHILTQNHHARLEAVATVTNIRNNI